MSAFLPQSRKITPELAGGEIVAPSTRSVNLGQDTKPPAERGDARRAAALGRLVLGCPDTASPHIAFFVSQNGKLKRETEHLQNEKPILGVLDMLRIRAPAGVRALMRQSPYPESSQLARRVYLPAAVLVQDERVTSHENVGYVVCRTASRYTHYSRLVFTCSAAMAGSTDDATLSNFMLRPFLLRSR